MGPACEASIWENDARKNPKLTALAARLGSLVKQYTKKAQVVGFPPE